MKKTALPPTILVIFGITGDLSHRYLLPALAEIKKVGQLPKGFKIIGVSRRNINLSEALGQHKTDLAALTEIFQMDLAQKTDYLTLKQKLVKAEQIIFYLAVPPAGVLPIINFLGQAKLNTPKSKLLLEKPFGVDLGSAKELIAATQSYFSEDQIYRIDHYLAKELVQNIAVFLGSNVLFRDVWSNQFIEYIEIVAAEKIGLEGRGNFYEQTGALRDFTQSHLLQLAALTLMEPCPHDYDFADLPQRRLAALRQLSVPAEKLDLTITRAQYKGYLEEVGVPHSNTETFVATKLSSEDPRWRGVPIYLATGKKLDQKLTQIRINFKKDSESEANKLVLRIQPKEGIELDLWVKQPGYTRKLQQKTLSFSYESTFKGRLPDAYEQVVVDSIRGSHSLFASSDEVLESWRILQPILDRWSINGKDLKFYKPGSSVEQVLSQS